VQTERPYTLSIAGFDPCSGAGVTADIKTFEQLKVYGLGICSALTLQTEDEFISVEWRKVEEVKKETELLLKKYPVKAVKFGIVPSFGFMEELVDAIKALDPGMKIVVDPVWKTSAGSVLNEHPTLQEDFLRKIDLFTPNMPELEWMSRGKDMHGFIDEITLHTSLLVKGGHKTDNAGVDTLYTKDAATDITSFETTVFPKHGSGCVLSAAITAHLALGFGLHESCVKAKEYIEKFLGSNKSLLGFHAA
jgi:hydroxymethylpyrimidine/phosphomethylpyrimidine kinase